MHDFQGAMKIKLNWFSSERRDIVNVEEATTIPSDLLRVGNGILVQILKRFTSDYQFSLFSAVKFNVEIEIKIDADRFSTATRANAILFDKFRRAAAGQSIRTLVTRNIRVYSYIPTACTMCTVCFVRDILKFYLTCNQAVISYIGSIWNRSGTKYLYTS